MKLLLATSNLGKLSEFRSLLSGFQLEVLSPQDLDLDLEVEETGSTYLENALLKARTYAGTSGLWSLADDTGLEVLALSGAPGLFSARYAPGEQATDADRRRYLLDNLAGSPRPWKARFVCTAVLCGPQGGSFHCQGLCRGEIIPHERGKRGFGYDPVFLVSGTGKTMAEMSLEEKNRLSHRARAVKGLQPRLEELLASEAR